jgi:hypothetical protein
MLQPNNLRIVKAGNVDIAVVTLNCSSNVVYSLQPLDLFEE